ncbi:MAG: RNA polymerase sigma factor [Bacteroidetes bacterium]|nr:MAG: RNA polymerase sigma factor [Bacteroidota bacterium]
MTDEQLIQACKKQQRQAQRVLYERLAPKLYQTCKRYLPSQHDIEEVLADTFFIVFTKIEQLKAAEAFEGWARRIAVNQCLAQLKKQTSFGIYVDDDRADNQADTSIDAPMDAEDLMKLLEQLPDGCRTVFNLYAIEGYAHKEIASLLGISEGTSKSQLNFSRKKLQELVFKFYDQSYKRHEQAR